MISIEATGEYMKQEKGTREGKIRVTLDLSPQFHQRLERLEALVEAGSKAGLIRQALQLYEFVAKKSLEGCEFKVVNKNGIEEKLVFLDLA